MTGRARARRRSCRERNAANCAQDTWLIDYCGAEDNAFNRGVSRMILIAGVRRIKRPGCKFDTLLVLESEEGLNKSTMLDRLAKRPGMVHGLRGARRRRRK
jgi:predicted P-loop ATPase